MRIRKKAPALQGIIMLACTLIVRFAVRPALAQTTDQNGANLLENGGFESPYYVDDRGDGGGEIAHGWSLWYFNDPGVEYDGPVYREATIEKDPTRIHDGVAAQQYYREYSRHLGGLYQTVEVPANSLVQLTIYGHAWSTFCETKHGQLECDPLDSSQGGLNPISMKVGIDPTGGTDP